MKNRFPLLLSVLSIFCFLSCGVLAESSSHIPCTCGRTPCACFIQLGDKGGFVTAIVQCLQARGYADRNTPTGEFTEEIEQAVLQFQQDSGLPRTGILDDDTLTLLLWDMTPEQLDAALPVRRSDPATYRETVWIPTDGGEKRHSNPACSGMLNPRKVSLRNAARAGFQPCGKCERGLEQNDLKWGKP